MTIETAFVISAISVTFAIYQGLANIKRNKTADDKNDASQLTTVIVKLENIGNGISEIKNELGNVKADIREDRERIVIVEESTKAVHKRLDTCEQYCKKFSNN
jgi:peptidoglycan hydrolase CwlO-like protein